MPEAEISVLISPFSSTQEGIQFSLIYEEELAPAVVTSETLRQKLRLLGRKAAAEAVRVIDPENAAPTLMMTNDSNGVPVWPVGVVGSITHTQEINQKGERDRCLALAVASKSNILRTVGIDVEHEGRPLSLAASRKICTELEREWVANKPERLLSIATAKEALYKALYPITGKFIGFSQAECLWCSDSRKFGVTLKTDLTREFRSGSEFKIPSVKYNGLIISYCPIL